MAAIDSPLKLYAMQTVFTADHSAVGVSPDQVYGVVSLVFWAITLIVSVKYVEFILRADNDGEGGIMALTALIQKLDFKSARTKVLLVTLGIIGASLFYGWCTAAGCRCWSRHSSSPS